MVMLDSNVDGLLQDQVAAAASSSSLSPLILSKTVRQGALSSTENDDPPSCRWLRLAMLGCEDDPPYGPTEHTGRLFLELICKALKQEYSADQSSSWQVSIAIYNIKLGDYPQDWNAYDGIIVPGSFSAAYDEDKWIETLKQVLQNEIVARRIPTLGICFGHQVLAHSFATGGGRAIQNPKGSRGGRFDMKTTAAGQILFGGKEFLPLYYTHGDMVETLPDSAIAIGAEEGDGLPAQAAAYFKDQQEAQRFQSGTDPTVKPFAISFQAHPEYAVSEDLGLQFTLDRILTAMAERNALDADTANAARKDAADTFDKVQQSSLDSFIASAKALGWFP